MIEHINGKNQLTFWWWSGPGYAFQIRIWPTPKCNHF